MKKMLPFVVDIIREYRTNDPNEIAKALGRTVTYAPLLGLRGIYMKLAAIKTIVIESSLEKDAQNVVLAHELGHIFLHNKGYNLLEIDVLSQKEQERKEFEANKFAFLFVAHTCLRNNIEMIDGIRNEQHLTVDEVVQLLKEFSRTSCYIEKKE